MEENKKQKRVGTIETIVWMCITAVSVFIITSYQYTKMSLENENLGFDMLKEGTVNYYSNSGDYDFAKLKKVLNILEKDYLYEYDIKTIEDGAIAGMLEALEEPYTSYFNASETEEFLTETEGEYEGIGVYISLDTDKDLVIVLTPIKGSPAEEAGIKPGDYILEIDGQDVQGSTLEEVASKIKGKKETVVQMKFARYSGDSKYETYERTIQRRTVELNSFEYEKIDNNIGYIAFDTFDEKAEGQFENAYKELVNKQKVKGLIIDLRNNPGGLVTTAVEIIDKLVPTGIITYTVDKNDKREYIYSDSVSCKIPIVLIVNENSASASEIMAGAIKENDVGKIVGVTTYGKGLVQEFKSLKDGTYVKITICEYFSPDGNKINEIGVEPDYIVEDNEETDKDEQLEKAIEVMNEMIK